MICIYRLWKVLGPEIVRPIISLPEDCDRLSYLRVKVCICIPCSRSHNMSSASAIMLQQTERECGSVMIVILCALYCNVFSPVNEVIWQCCHWLASALPVRSHVFEGGVVLESDLQGGWDLMLSKLACYCYPTMWPSTVMHKNEWKSTSKMADKAMFIYK